MISVLGIQWVFDWNTQGASFVPFVWLQSRRCAVDHKWQTGIEILRVPGTIVVYVLVTGRPCRSDLGFVSCVDLYGNEFKGAKE